MFNPLSLLEFGVSRLREPPEGPQGFHQDARRPVLRFAAVALANPTMQAVHDSWKERAWTRRASGVWGFW